MRKVLGVDVDLTVFRTDLVWLDWLNKLTGSNISIKEGTYPYNLTEMFPNMQNWGDGLEFWRGEDIYDNLTPMEGCQEFLSKANINGWDILFVSQIKGNHQKSKYYALKKHFPYMAGAIWTKEKHYVRVDAMIDDRVNVLNKMPSNVKCFLMDTPYSQTERIKRTMTLTNWHDITLGALQ